MNSVNELGLARLDGGQRLKSGAERLEGGEAFEAARHHALAIATRRFPPAVIGSG